MPFSRLIFYIFVLLPSFTPTANAIEKHVPLELDNANLADMFQLIEKFSRLPVEDKTTAPSGKFNLPQTNPITYGESYILLERLLLLHGVKLEVNNPGTPKLVATSTRPATAEKWENKIIDERAPRLIKSLNLRKNPVNLKMVNIDIHDAASELSELTGYAVLYSKLPSYQFNINIGSDKLSQLGAFLLIDKLFGDVGIIIVEKDNLLLLLPKEPPQFEE